MESEGSCKQISGPTDRNPSKNAGKKNTGSKKKTTNTAKAKSQTSKKRSTGKTTQKTRVSTSQMQNVSVTNSLVSNEVILWATLAVSILLFLGDLGFGGVIGDNVGRFFFGLFGILSYGFPFLLSFLVFFMVSNQKSQIAVAKVIAWVCLFLFLITFIDLFSRDGMVVLPTVAYAYGFQYKTGGGFFGGGLAYLLVNGFGLIGAYVIDVIGMIISFVLISETSLFRTVKNKTRHDRVRAEMRRKEKDKKRNARRVEIQKEKEEELKKKSQNPKKNRIEVKNNGVTFDTTVENTKIGDTEDVKELNINIYNPSAEVEDINRVSLTSNVASKTEISSLSKDSDVTNAQSFVAEPVKEVVATPEPVKQEKPPEASPAERYGIFP